MTYVRTAIWSFFALVWLADCTTLIGQAPDGALYLRDSFQFTPSTLWSWTLHTVCFYPFAPSSFWMYLTYGPSLSGAWALMLMYIWTLIANPSMEFDLAPKGRPEHVIWARASLLHFGPPVFHALYRRAYSAEIAQAYRGTSAAYPLKIWSAVGGYVAMALAWEHSSGNAAATYNVTWVSNTVFTNVAKVTGVSGALLAYWVLLDPVMTAQTKLKQTKLKTGVKDEPKGLTAKSGVKEEAKAAKAPDDQAQAASASSSYLPPSLKQIRAPAKDK